MNTTTIIVMVITVIAITTLVGIKVVRTYINMRSKTTHIMKVKFMDYNQMDNMYLVVDSMSDKVIFTNRKIDNDGEFFVTIYEDGFANYGYLEYCDPLHGNQPYIWSSRCDVINKEFNLVGTELQLAIYDVGVTNTPNSCYRSSGILLSKALEIAKKNTELLHYGYDEFYKRYSI